MPEDLSRFMFIALIKKPSANECERHQATNESHNKTHHRILMNRASNRIRPEIGQEQRGFILDTRTMLILLSECYQNVQKDLYVDYLKAFDMVRYEKIV